MNDYQGFKYDIQSTEKGFSFTLWENERKRLERDGFTSEEAAIKAAKEMIDDLNDIPF